MAELEKLAKEGQYPVAIVVTCIDSRVDVELMFDCAVGDIFTARLAGNICTPEVIGSIEFACAIAGATLVLVLGHSHCGAVKGAIAKVKLGSLASILEKIEPAIEATKDF